MDNRGGAIVIGFEQGAEQLLRVWIVGSELRGFGNRTQVIYG